MKSFFSLPPSSLPAALALSLLLGVSSAGAQTVVYNDTSTFGGQAFANSGAVASNTAITRLVADDITFAAGFVGFSISNFVFSVANLDPTTDFSARPRVRFYQDDGAGGGPGTLINGFSFNAITFTHSQVALFNFNPAAGNIVIPADGRIWAGITFDNVGGTATQAQLDELGQGLYNPPTVGSSADTYFITTATGSFLANSPAGTITNFGGNPVANFGWRFQVVPEPSSIVLAAFGGIGLLLSARRFKRRN
jgi:hypothetical protein